MYSSVFIDTRSCALTKNYIFYVTVKSQGVFTLSLDEKDYNKTWALKLII